MALGPVSLDSAATSNDSTRRRALAVEFGATCGEKVVTGVYDRQRISRSDAYHFTNYNSVILHPRRGAEQLGKCISCNTLGSLRK